MVFSIRETIRAPRRGRRRYGFLARPDPGHLQDELGIERETLVPAAFFEQLLAALDADDEVPAELRNLARQPRVFERG